MFTALLSFLGGNVFRMIFGEAISYFNKKQEHAQEVERMQLQGQLEAAQFDRNQAAIKLQADMGIKVVEAQATAHISQDEADGWLEAVKAVGQKVGIIWVDGWNAAIRPAAATWAMVMMTLVETGAISKMTDDTAAICGAALGIYLADRSLMKRGK